MGTKYSSQSTSGYNATPPADDGSEVASNQVFWSTIKTKLSDVLKTFAEAIDSTIVTALDQSVLNTSVARTTIAGDHIRTINVTAAAPQSLGDAATMATGYIVTIKNSHTAAITVDLATGTDTLNGTVAGSYSLQAGEERTFRVNSTANGYLSSASNGVFTSVTSNSTIDATGAITGGGLASFTSTDDVDLVGASGSVIVGGDGTGQHVAIDGNEIMSKSDATTAGTLDINAQGGTVQFGSITDLTSFAVDATTSAFTGNATVSGTLGVTGAINPSSTVDGRDIAADGTKLDGIYNGNVSSTGTVSGSSGFTVSNTGTGAYTMTHNLGNGNYSLVMQANELHKYVFIFNKSTNTIQYNTGFPDGASGTTASDCAVHFILTKY